MDRRTFLMAGLAATSLSIPAGATSACDVAQTLRRPLNRDGGLYEMIRMAVLAPNGHNTQGWRFSCRGKTIELTADMTRRTPVVDPDDHHLYVSLGCAAENLVLAGRVMGRVGDATVTDDGAVNFSWTAGPRVDDPLAGAIVRRQSSRGLYDGHALSGEDLNVLTAASTIEGVRMVLLTAQGKMAALRDLIVAGNNAQMDDPAFLDELKRWLRFTERRAVESADGLFAAASGNPTMPDFIPDSLARFVFDVVFRKGAEDDKYVAQMKSSAGTAVFFAEKADKRHWVQVGRAAERFQLAATLRDIRTAFVNQPVEVARLRPALAALCGERGLRPDLVVRFGRGALLPYSLRRPVEAVAHFA